MSHYSFNRLYFAFTLNADVTPVANGSWGSIGSATNKRLLYSNQYPSDYEAGSLISWTAGSSGLDRRYVSGPMTAQTISGTVKGQILATESNADDNARIAVEIYVVSFNGSTVRGTLLSGPTIRGSGTELTVTTVNKNRSFLTGESLSSLAVQDGDRLVICMGFMDSGGTTPSAQAFYGFSGLTDLPEDEVSTTYAATWIEFSNAITFREPQKYHFPFSLAADVSPVANGTWNDTNDAVERKMVVDPGLGVDGSSTNAGSTISWTAGSGKPALDRTYVSGPLAAQGLGGEIKCQIRCRELAGSDNVHGRLEVYVVNRAGNAVRGTLLPIGEYGIGSELVSVATHTNHCFAGDNGGSLYKTNMTPVTLQDGDRVVVKIGYADNTGTTPQAVALWGDPPSESHLLEDESDTAGVPWIEFGDGLVLLDESFIPRNDNIKPSLKKIRGSYDTIGDGLRATSSNSTSQGMPHTLFRRRPIIL